MARRASNNNYSAASDNGRLYYTVNWKERPYSIEPRHEFDRDGYRMVDSQLGEDPLTALRTMKNRLTQLATKANRKNRPILNQMALSATESLSNAESTIARLQSRRSDALFAGDAKAAEQLSRQMRDIIDQAIFNANADLLLNREEASVFGVKSKWSQTGGDGKGKKRRSRRDRRGRSKKADIDSEEEEDVSSYNNSRPPPPPPTPRRLNEWRGGLKERLSEVGTRRPTTNVKMDNLNTDNDSPKKPSSQPTKRNRRMVDADGDGTGQEPPVSNAVICPYCGGRDPGFVNEDYLKKHFAEECINLTKCEYCDAIIEPSELNDHQLHRCPFVENTLEACDLCGLARYPGEDDHPKCRGKEPPDGGAWCPLCSSLVKDGGSKEAWKQHMINDCYNNPHSKRWPQMDTNNLDGDRRGDKLLGNLIKQKLEEPPPSINKRRAQQQRSGGAPTGGAARSQSAPAPQNEVTREQAANMEQLRRAFKRLNQERRANYHSSSKPIRAQHDSDSD